MNKKYKYNKKFLGGALSAVGTAIGGPVGGMVGGVAGAGLQSLLNKPKKQENLVQPAYSRGTMGYKYGGKLKYKYGGAMKSKLPKYPMGGELPIGPDAGLYTGPSHEQGGIPVDSQGHPTSKNQATAEVEGGETRQGDYIFSDELIVPGTEMTFSEVHQILVEEGDQEAIQELMQLQEEVREQSELSDQSTMGSDSQMYEQGGELNSEKEPPRQLETWETWNPNRNRIVTDLTSLPKIEDDRFDDDKKWMSNFISGRQNQAYNAVENTFELGRERYPRINSLLNRIGVYTVPNRWNQASTVYGYNPKEKAEQIIDRSVENVNSVSFSDGDKIRNDTLIPRVKGLYNSARHRIYTDRPGTITTAHELGHASRLDQNHHLNLLMSSVLNDSERFKNAEDTRYNRYLKSPEEIYSRIWEIRRELDLSPNDEVTPDMLQSVDSDIFRILDEDEVSKLMNVLVHNDSENKGELPKAKHGGNINNFQKKSKSMNKGEQNNNEFSDKLIVPGTEMTFAEAHEMLIAEGASEQEIQELQQMQEQVRMESGAEEMPMGEEPIQPDMMGEEIPMMAQGGHTRTHQFQNQPYNRHVNRRYPSTTPQGMAPNSIQSSPASNTTPSSNAQYRANQRYDQSMNRFNQVVAQDGVRVANAQKWKNFGKALGKRMLGGIGTVLTMPDNIADSSLTGKYGEDEYLNMLLEEADNNNFQPLKEALIEEGYTEEEVEQAIAQYNMTEENQNDAFPEYVAAPDYNPAEFSEANTPFEDQYAGGTADYSEPSIDGESEAEPQSPNQQRQLNVDTSIVDYLASQGMDNSFQARKALFEQEMGGENYRGTAEQNIRLLQYMMQSQEGEDIMQDNIEPERSFLNVDTRDPLRRLQQINNEEFKKGGYLPYKKYGGKIKKKVPTLDEGGWLSRNSENLQRFLPSAIDASLALVTPRQKDFKPETVTPQTTRVDPSGFNRLRGDIVTSARTAIAGGANPGEVHAQTLRGLSQATAGQNELQANVDNQNAQLRQSADSTNVQMQNQAQQANLQNRAQDAASRINSLRTALERPLNMMAADKAGERQQNTNLMIAASRIEDPATRNQFLEMMDSYINGNMSIQEILEQMRSKGVSQNVLDDILNSSDVAPQANLFEGFDPNNRIA